MRRPMINCLSVALAASAAGLVPAGVAEADTVKAGSSVKKVKAPAITRVSPMRVKVGRRITIRGVNFSAARKRNTVIFRSPGGRSALVRPVRATRSKLVVTIPASAERLLTKKSSRGVATRLKLRVVTKRYGKLSKRRNSPVVLTALKSGKTAACGKGSDWDGDFLGNDIELKYALDPCKIDTDGDGMGDGFEYWSAKDLNVKAVPYPGKKPYPNPLQADDAKYDFDGDGLDAGVEYKLWKAAGSSFDPSRANNGLRDSPLGYSDGTQTSRPGEVPAIPAFKGFPGLGAAYPGRLVMRDDGGWSDDERDADSDGLNNYVETVGPGRAGWWPAYFAKREPDVQPWPETYYGPFLRRPFADTEATDPDVDGDTQLDAEDDQDTDDVQNFYEMYDPVAPHSNGQRKNAFNPCAPDPGSRTCPPSEAF